MSQNRAIPEQRSCVGCQLHTICHGERKEPKSVHREDMGAIQDGTDEMDPSNDHVGEADSNHLYRCREPHGCSQGRLRDHKWDGGPHASLVETQTTQSESGRAAWNLRRLSAKDYRACWMYQ